MITPIFRRLAKARLPDIPGAILPIAGEIGGIIRKRGPADDVDRIAIGVDSPRRTRLRYPVPCAVETLVFNHGPVPAAIYENARLVCYLQVNDWQFLPLGGKGLIEAISSGASIEVVTKVQECELSYLPPAPVPVGAFLL